MSVHSSVIYVEPNIEVGYGSKDEKGNEIKGWRVEDHYDRTPRLEDYCIAMNIEVEVCSRENVVTSDEGTTNVLILQYTRDGEGKDFVNFMGGTRIGGWNISGVNKTNRIMDNGIPLPNYLTTYYADMYVGDLINYGTTEMLGIKSVTIEYEKNCVPVINVTFTDVRGLSLFQPTEFSRDRSYNNIKGINKDNVAQSFFQCFFRMPLPKFTFYIKGFYGRPVAYEVMCDKFETNFNSDTGDFDVNTRFIGYNYSFLTDVTLDALMAAPYSDYKGEEYWKSQVSAGRFKLWDRNHTHQVDMPTLIDIKKKYDSVIVSGAPSPSMDPTEAENETHDDEINALMQLRKKYEEWYAALYNVVCQKYGKKYCFEFKETNSDADYYRILVLTNVPPINTVGGSNVGNMKDEYQQFPDDFKTLNKNTAAEIEKYNQENSSKFDVVSKDFSDYQLRQIFKPVTGLKESNGKIVGYDFNGFDNELDDEKLKTDIIERMLKDTSATTSSTTLATIYGNGNASNGQYLYGYIIEVDYSGVKARMNALDVDAKRDSKDKAREEMRREYNERMFNMLNWYPSVENFSKVMMCHLETFMHIMYTAADEIRIQNRSLDDLGVPPETVSDADEGAFDYVPPFPRVVKQNFGDDGIARMEDSWVGEYVSGIGFKEVDVVNGFFNAIEKLNEILRNAERSRELQAKVDENAKKQLKVPYPMTPFDFMITKSPYGTSSTNLNEFFGFAALRMLTVLGLNNFNFDKSGDLTRIAKIEAKNCVANIPLDETFLTKISKDEDTSVVNGDNIFELLTKGTPIEPGSTIPWVNGEKQNLFTPNDIIGGYWLSNRYHVQEGYLYPMQCQSFDEINEAYAVFAKNGGNASNEDIHLVRVRSDQYRATTNQYHYFNILIDDDVKFVENAIGNGIETFVGNEKIAYDSEFTDKLNYSADAQFANGDYGEFFLLNNDEYRTSLRSKEGINIKGKHFVTRDDFESKFPSTYSTESLEHNFSDSFILETFAWKKDSSGELELDKKTGLFSYKDSGKTYFDAIEMVSVTEGEKRINQTRDKNDLNLVKMSYFVLSLDCFDYSLINNYLNKNRNILYLPKLVLLQLGGALYNITNVTSGVSTVDFESAKKRVPMPNSFKKNAVNVFKHFNGLSLFGIRKYFIDWAQANYSNIISTLKVDERFFVTSVIEDAKSVGKKLDWADAMQNHTANMAGPSGAPKIKPSEKVIAKYGNTRVIYSPLTTKALTADVMKAVSVVNANNILRNKNGDGLPESVIKEYFKQFLNGLREEAGLKAPDEFDEQGNPVTVTKTPTTTTDEMKKELYRYLKLLYDKWIPATPKKFWSFENFFEDEKGVEGKETWGNLFHFIDSYYNKIGDKLIINPRTISEKLNTAFETTDVNTMMLGFMADIYAENKCMMICLQNFADLSNTGAMQTMFKPLPYNEAPLPQKHPDFVIIYPYEPSKNLNIPNNEYKDDSFMLNDENETPLAIKSRDVESNRCYRIPAFGVCYGKQYQSYFKKVNVNMGSPIATQQSIAAKHSILRNAEYKNVKTSVGQDIYDIYSTQSYTCTVEMMGCAWVQPLMYFVLTNVPMFRGSYMIMKVKHSITAGDMTTEFTGCRMANVSNKMTEQLFTDDEYDAAMDRYEIEKARIADVTNDCGYKVYPLFSSSNLEISKDEAENAKKAMTALMGYGFTKEAAAGICGNIYKESSWQLHVTNSIGAFALCQWTSSGNRKERLIAKYGKLPTFGDQMEYINFEWDGGDSIAHSKKSALMSAKSPEDAAYIVMEWFERPSQKEKAETIQGRKDKAREYYDNYSPSVTSETSKPDKDPNKDLYQPFLDAVQATANSSDSARANLKKLMSGKKIMMIFQDGGRTDKLPAIFDIILNENEYCQYVRELWWMFPPGGMLGEPGHIDVVLNSDKAGNNANRRVYIGEMGSNTKYFNGITKNVTAALNGEPNSESKNSYRTKKFTDDAKSTINKKFLTSLYKRYVKGGASKKEIPQFANAQHIFDDIDVTSCKDLLGGGSGGSGGGTGYYGSNELDSKLLPTGVYMHNGWDAGKSANWLIANYKNVRKCPGDCAITVQTAIQKGGGKSATGWGFYTALHLHEQCGWSILFEGRGDDDWFKTYKPNVGDVMGMQKNSIPLKDKVVGTNAHCGHVCMYCGEGNGWYADCNQRRWLVYNHSDHVIVVRLVQ